MTRAKDISKIVTDANLSGTLDVTGTVTAGAVAVDNITIDATEIDSTSALTLDSAGTISLDADSGSINLLDGGVTHAEFINSSNDFIIKSSQSDKDIIFKGVDGISLIEAMRIDMSAGGNVGIGTTDVRGKLQIGSGNGGGNTPSSHELLFGANNSDITFLSDSASASVDGTIGAWNTVYNFQNSKIVFDKPSANTGQLQFFTNAGSGITERMRIDSSGNVGIGTDSPSSFNQYADNLVVGTTSGENGITIASGTGNSGRFVFSDNATGAGSFVGAIEYSHSSDAMILYTATSERMRIDSSGNVGIGKTVPLSKLDVTGGFITVSKDANSAGRIGASEYITGSTDNDLVIQATGSGVTKFYQVGVNSLNITSAGNVGIGNSNPEDFGSLVDNLVVGTTSGENGITIASGTGNGGRIQFADNTSSPFRGAFEYDHSSDAMIFYTNGSGRMRIDSSGRMLLNTTAHTNGRLNVTENLSTRPCLGLRSNYSANTGNFVLFTSDNGTGAGAISHINASTVAYNTSSDYRLKQNVTYDFDATTRLKQLQPARFSWNHDDTNTLVDGFLAHEVQSVVPEAITGNKDAVDADGNPVYQGIDQSKLVPLLVKTIQELEARITALENGE